MPDQKISQMDPAAALTGAELVPAVQSGGNVRTTTQDIANLVSLSSLGASANGITLIGHTFAQMRADLDLEAGTDFVAYSAYSANALTLIGHTFAQMRTDLSLVPGTDVQVYSAKLAALAAQTWAADTITYQTSTSAVSTTALTAFGRSLIDDADAATARTTLGLVIGTNVQAYDADTAKTDVAQSWTANQIFGGSTADVASFYRSGAAAKTRWIESTNNNYHGIRNNANTLTFDSNGTDYLTFSSTGAATFGSVATFNYGLDITSGALQASNGFHVYFSSNTSYLRSLQNGVAWRAAELDAATLTINASSLGRVIIAGGPTSQPAAGAHSNATQISNSDINYGLLLGSLSSGNGFIQAQRVDGTATTYNLSLQPNGGSVVTGGAVTAGGPVNLKSYTVAGLPAGSAADAAYASNGRKNGEGAGAGTGVLVFKDGTAWRACDTGATVAA